MTTFNAIGMEPYDKSYGLGYQVGHEDFSPFPRINRLREVFFGLPFAIDSQRARLVTEVYKANPSRSNRLNCAYALKNVVEQATLYLYDDELIIGGIAAPAKAAPIYPEFSVDWILDELVNHPFQDRPHDAFEIDGKTRDELLEILPFWQGKTVSDEVNSDLSDAMRRGSQLGKRVFMTNLYHFGGIGHYVLDYPKLMQVGFAGLVREAEQDREALRQGGQLTEQAEEFFEAVIVSLEAATTFVERYAQLAQEQALAQTDARRREELLQIAENCRQIASGPAQTFWQALQLWHFATSVAHIESNGHSVSYGRMDQWLYPYYERDLREGRITREFACELLECVYLKMNNPSKLKDRGTVQVRNGRGWGGESLAIGGVREDGTDATNDLTFLMLEASVHTRLMNPWVCVRMHADTPYELKVKAAECIRAGYGHPKLFHDETAITVMQRKGMSLEEARDYDVVGCVEPDLPGREYGFHDAAYLNMAKVMELALNGGRCIDCSEHCPRHSICAGAGLGLGPNTGRLDQAATMEDVLQSFDRQLEFWCGEMCEMVNRIDVAHRKLKPTSYVSALFQDCLATGRDVSEGGARYNTTGPQACGIATCADTLSTIAWLVFEQKRYTGAQLLQAVRDNWEGHEVLYAYVNGPKVPHFGNDDDRADQFYDFVFNTFCKHIEGRKNPRGGFFCPGVYSVNANVGMGLALGASIDGRKAGEPISDNMGPVHTAFASHDVEGPTAIANSVNKVDHSRATNGTLLNWKFPPECVAGDRGRENLIRFVDGYFSGSAMHCQFNIMSSATMRAAMERPQDYRDMLVRVAGYSAYFVELSKPLQMDLINRTELSF